MKVCPPGALDAKGGSSKLPFASPSSKTTPSVNGCCSSRRDPSTDYCHTDCHTLAAPSAPAAPEVPMPTGASPRETWRLAGIRQAARKRAERAVKLQSLAEGRLFDYDERQRRETAATMQFLWDSGEPVWMDEVRLWLAADPSRKLDLSVPTGANSASISHYTHERKQD
jgi:hypothetical protein